MVFAIADSTSYVMLTESVITINIMRFLNRIILLAFGKTLMTAFATTLRFVEHRRRDARPMAA